VRAVHAALPSPDAFLRLVLTALLSLRRICNMWWACMTRVDRWRGRCWGRASPLCAAASASRLFARTDLDPRRPKTCKPRTLLSEPDPSEWRDGTPRHRIVACRYSGLGLRSEPAARLRLGQRRRRAAASRRTVCVGDEEASLPSLPRGFPPQHFLSLDCQYQMPFGCPARQFAASKKTRIMRAAKAQWVDFAGASG
jgi:hypothetical protein